jgi:hypothetical protein
VRGGGVEAVVAKITGHAERAAAQPELAKRDQPRAAPDRAEAVDVAVVGFLPAGEFDPQFEAGVSLADEFGLVEPERDEQVVYLRDRRFAHPDDADLVGFDECDRRVVAEKPGQDRRRHPPGRPAAGDHDVERAGRKGIGTVHATSGLGGAGSAGQPSRARTDRIRTCR